jgi:glyoxylase-like metal-dependent hydrolase (beta-lactamase superfamily II)
MRNTLCVTSALLAAMIAAACLSGFRSPAAPLQSSIQSGTFPPTWINGGPACGTEPAFQVHAYNPDFYILRQSLCTNYEAPFLFLIFGSQKAILFDTGAGNAPVQATVQGVVNTWLAAHNQSSIQLIVAHLHSHGDHIAGDSQFQGQPNTTVVGTSLSAVQSFWGFTQWPTQQVTYDLGGRVLDVLAIPGHQAAHIAVYDRQTAILLTGDSLYPGRLYVNGATSQGNWGVYRTSIQRLVTFGAANPVVWVLGTHVELADTVGVQFPVGSTSHPNEHALQLTYRHLLILNRALQALPNPQITPLAEFIIYPSG